MNMLLLHVCALAIPLSAKSLDGYESYRSHKKELLEAVAALPLEKAIASLRGLSEQGDPVARAVFAGALHEGRGVEKDKKKAAELFDAALPGVREFADKGDNLARNVLGGLYERGQGAALDPAKAAKLYRKACGMKDADACWFLADMYAEGQGVERDPGKVLELYAEACAMGSGSACHNLGAKYRGGEGVAKDSARARDFFRRACHLGRQEGCDALGIVTAAKAVNGLLEEYSAKLKPANMRMACLDGDAKACLGLGRMHLSGEGAPKDGKEAFVWLSLAVARGDADAGKLLAELEKDLPAADRDAALETLKKRRTGTR